MSLADAVLVTAGMRPWDRACLEAATGCTDAEQFAVLLWQCDGPAWTLAADDGAPLAVGGLQFVNDWAGVLWFVATERLGLQSWGKVLHETRRLLDKVSDPACPYYRHRIEAVTHAEWHGAQKLARRAGLELEGVRRGAGRHGEDFNVWVRVNPPKEQ